MVAWVGTARGRHLTPFVTVVLAFGAGGRGGVRVAWEPMRVGVGNGGGSRRFLSVLDAFVTSVTLFKGIYNDAHT